MGRQPIGAQAVVVADQEGGHAEAVSQDISKVFFRGERCERPGEIQDFDARDAEAGKQRLLFLERIQKAEFAGAVLEDRPRMRPERDDKGLVSALTREGDESLDHETVAEMDAVEKACGRNH